MAEAKQPGGYYLNPDKKSAHDAEGKPVPLIKGKDQLRAEAEAKAAEHVAAQKLAEKQAEKDKIVADALATDGAENSKPEEPEKPKRGS